LVPVSWQIPSTRQRYLIHDLAKKQVSNCQAYFARARCYLSAVMSLQNLETVQALLCLVQYYFRASVSSTNTDKF
jgi:hypothetical protein